MSEEKPDIRDLTREQLREAMLVAGDKAFRGDQIFDWLWNKHSRSFAEMTNIPSSLRDALQQTYVLHKVELAEKQVSNDGTIKCAFRVGENQVVEGVLIPAEDRMTACISSQVGCSLSCKFCATGRLRRMRNLSAAEIYDQVVMIGNLAREHYQKPLTNIVYMGMGEPLLNYQNVMRSITMITSDEGLGMAARRITVSTAGIAKMIHKLAEDKVRFNLALSLHAANDEKRSSVMEINDTNDLQTLADALNHFIRETGNKPTFEYIIFDGFNDQPADALELARYCRKVPAKVNIIEYNPIDDSEFRQAAPGKVDAFRRILEDHGVIATVRRSRGKDIDAACGQLANKNKLAARA
jgi:23S rRNA (adenine2503-C2)-methyltransferase